MKTGQRSLRRGRRPAARADLDLPLEGLPGIAARRAELYAAAGLVTRRHLLYHLPVRYRIRPAAAPLAQAQEGGVAALSGRVLSGSLRRRGRRSTVSLQLACDGGGVCTVLLFNRAWLARDLKGTRLWVAGRFSRDEVGAARLLAADHEPLGRAAEDREHAPVALPPLPLYRLPPGIPPRVHRRLLAALLDAGAVPDWRSAPELADVLPPVEPALHAALLALHRPADVDSARTARRRLAADEAFALALDVTRRRHERAHDRAVPLPLEDADHLRLLALLPHVPTAAQTRVIAELRAELSGRADGRPMARLLQGDVGSGKTLVAAYALLAAALAGRQAALMAPTAILARQHAATLAAWLSRVPGQVAPPVFLLASGEAPAEARAARRRLAAGGPAIAVGTHALAGAATDFADLAVCVIDEQHRFGVAQRVRLRAKGAAGAHLLVTTATPIPRTLALAACGELDVSVLDELPPGRAPRTTELVPPSARAALWRELRAAVARGERGYVVCPSIGAAVRSAGASAAEPAAAPGDELDGDEGGSSVAEWLPRVRRALGPAVAVGAVHGQMPAAERDAVLADFRSGRLAVLVATVLVEVGLDVPEAVFVVVPDPARFGLATLHQVRGRVGRGSRPGRCLLLGPVAEGPAAARVAALLACEDGFELAEQDLRLRGPGEILGTAQHGLPDFAALDPVRDGELVAVAQTAARAVVARSTPAALSRLRAAAFPLAPSGPRTLLAGG